MARLSHSGSTNHLRRQLFPVGFAGEVMLLVLQTWRKFSVHHNIRHEEPITALFRSALIEAYVAGGRKWFVTLEDPVTDPNFGTELGRNDIRFYPDCHYGQSIFFTVECKRLRVRTDSGFKHLADEYAVEGVQRFVDGKYSEGLPCGGIVGYVMDSDMTAAFAKIQAEMNGMQVTLKMPSQNGISIPSALLPDYEWSIDTVHDRSEGRFVVHHVLVAVKRKRRSRRRVTPN